NTAINSVSYNKVKSHGYLSGIIEAVKQKNSKVADFDSCYNNEINNNKSYYKAYNTEDTDMPEACKNCQSSSNVNSCLYGVADTDCKMYLPYDYKCKEEHCKGNGGKDLKYCEIESIALALVGNCGKYKSEYRETSKESYFDCGLYFSADNGQQKIFESFKTLVNPSGYDNIAHIKSGCQNLLPLDEDTEEVASDSISSMIKPYKSTKTLTTLKGSATVGRDDLERYGCSQFTYPDSSTSVYGCKLPSGDSSYISKIDSRPPLVTRAATSTEKQISSIMAILSSDTGGGFDYIINGATFKTFTEPKKAVMSAKVCSRYPNDVYSRNSSYKCVARE
ncbi:MAG: hypothetical protein LBP39_01195, partial [Rickettsiales bacterium]|nr:hypothetical protein [Rickettsiales bacterium]